MIWNSISHFLIIKSTNIGGVNTPKLLFYIQNFKNVAPSGYGFIKKFRTCEQLVLIYRTNYSLGCKKKKKKKNNTIILIEKGEERKKK